jgi:hypothetical protein
MKSSSLPPSLVADLERLLRERMREEPSFAARFTAAAALFEPERVDSLLDALAPAQVELVIQFVAQLYDDLYLYALRSTITASSTTDRSFIN